MTLATYLDALPRFYTLTRYVSNQGWWSHSSILGIQILHPPPIISTSRPPCLPCFPNQPPHINPTPSLTLHSLLIGRDGGALDANIVLLDGLSRVNGDLVVSLVTVRKTQVVVLAVHIQVGEHQLKREGKYEFDFITCLCIWEHKDFWNIYRDDRSWLGSGPRFFFRAGARRILSLVEMSSNDVYNRCSCVLVLFPAFIQTCILTEYWSFWCCKSCPK